MNIQKCVRGHFYDSDRYDSCPHCESESSKSSPGPAPQAAANVIGSTVQNADFRGFGDEDQEGIVVITPAAQEEEDVTVLVTPEMERNVVPERGMAMARVPERNAMPEREVAMARVPERNVMPEREVAMAQVPERKAAADRMQEEELTMRFSPAPPESDPMIGLLICIKGRGVGKHFMLRSRINGIGRSVQTEITVRSAQGSGESNYAYLCYDPDSRRFWLQPGELQGYIYLNEAPLLESKWLNHHDRLQVGEELLLFIPICGPEFAWEDLN